MRRNHGVSLPWRVLCIGSHLVAWASCTGPHRKHGFNLGIQSNGVEKSHNLISLFESFIDILLWARHGVGFWPGNPYGTSRRRVWCTMSSCAIWSKFKKICGLCQQHSTRACIGIQHMAAPLLVQAENESINFTRTKTARFQFRSFHRPVLER